MPITNINFPQWKIVTCRGVGHTFGVGHHVARHGAIPDKYKDVYFMEEGIPENTLDYLSIIQTGFEAFYPTYFYIFSQSAADRITRESKNLGGYAIFTKVNTLAALDYRKIDLGILKGRYPYLESDEEIFNEILNASTEEEIKLDTFYLWDLPKAENHSNEYHSHEMIEVLYNVIDHDGEDDEIESIIPKEWLNGKHFFSTYDSIWIRDDVFLKIEGDLIFDEISWSVVTWGSGRES